MAAPDFFFAVNAMFRYLHDRYGKSELVRYWRRLGQEYYRTRVEQWRQGGVAAIAEDWKHYFAPEPDAVVEVKTIGEDAVELDIAVCPAIKHLRDHGRDIVPYFCEHCDHVCGAMAESAGFSFERVGGMGSCVQRFVKLRVNGEAV